MAWRVARSLDVLLGQINTRFPQRSKASDGSIGDRAHAATKSEHNPDHLGIVRARDFTHDPAHGVDIDRLSDELAASRDPRIRYIIANALILDSRPGNRPWQWVKYAGSNPHTKHLHLSVVADARADDPRPWDLPMLRPEGDDDMSAEAEKLIHDIHREITQRLPSRSEYAEPPWADTLLGTTLNAEGRAHEAIIELRALVAGLPRMIRDEVRAVLAEERKP